MIATIDTPYVCTSHQRWSGTRLAGLVAETLAEPARWVKQVKFDDTERFCLLLDRDDEHDLWLLTWLPGQETGWHDHGGSTGAFTVARGALRERRPLARRGLQDVRLGPGASRLVPNPVLHNVGNHDAAPAVSLHAYSPPLSTMTFFDDAQLVRV